MGAVLGGWSYSGVWSFQTGAHWEPFRGGAARLSGNSDPTAGPLTGCYAVPFVAANCTNSGGDYNLDHGRNDRPDSTLSSFNPGRDLWKTGWDPSAGTGGTPILSSPCLACASNLGRNTFVGPGLWQADMTLAKLFKFTERVNLKFEAQAFNVFNRANFLIATAGGAGNNDIRLGSEFGKAGGTLNARNLQFGLKLTF